MRGGSSSRSDGWHIMQTQQLSTALPARQQLIAASVQCHDKLSDHWQHSELFTTTHRQWLHNGVGVISETLDEASNTAAESRLWQSIAIVILAQETHFYSLHGSDSLSVLVVEQQHTPTVACFTTNEQKNYQGKNCTLLIDFGLQKNDFYVFFL